MKICIISDIHGNNVGLETVLKDMGKVDTIICAGDITGYYPFVNEVIDLLIKHRVLSVKGNHDQYLLNGKAPDYVSEQVRESVDRTKKEISIKSLEFIKNLSESLSFSIESQKVLVFHAAPWDIYEKRIYPNYDRFDDFRDIEADVIILGHTHYPMVKKIGKLTLVNPGSCGQPRDYNLLSYTVWDTDRNSFENKRIKWDIEQFKRKARERGTREELFKVFDRKKD